MVVHVPSAAQHAPLGASHDTVLQATPAEKVPAQATLEVIVQAPPTQQAPSSTGAEHTVDAQAAPAVKAPEQPSTVVSAQLPSSAQHVPTGVQAASAQVPIVKVPLHASAVVSWHPAALQQAPVVGRAPQSMAVQSGCATLTPPFPSQVFRVARRQVPLVVQQPRVFGGWQSAQLPPAVNAPPSAEHCVSVDSLHPPCSKQHAPFTVWAQCPGVHRTPSVKVPSHASAVP